MHTFTLFYLFFVVFGAFFSYAGLPIAEQNQEELFIDGVISDIKQKSSTEEYGVQLYKKALFYMQEKKKRNSPIIIRLLEEAGEQDHAVSLKILARLYESGQEGVPRNLSRAIELYQRAVQLKSPAAMTSLAYLYEHGMGVPQNLGRAVELYQQAVQMGYAPAMMSLMYLYKHGKGVPQDLEQAFTLLQQAGRRAYFPAIILLATVYAKGGMWVSVDYVKAKEWIDLVADNHLSNLPSNHQKFVSLRRFIYSRLESNIKKPMSGKRYSSKFIQGSRRGKSCRDSMRY